jgi:hypothetical protein
MQLSDKHYKSDLWEPGHFFSAGNILLQSTSDSDYLFGNNTLSSVVISRRRFKNRIEHEQQMGASDSSSDSLESQVETFVSPESLAGLLPDSLLDAYKFWQTSDERIWGYPRPASEVKIFKVNENDGKEDRRRTQRKHQTWGGSMLRVDRYHLSFKATSPGR